MKKNLIIGYVIFSIFIFLGLIAWGIFRTSQITIETSDLQKQELEKISKKIAGFYIIYGNFNIDTKSLTNIFETSPGLLMFIIYSQDNGILNVVSRNKSYYDYLESPLSYASGWKDRNWLGNPLYNLPSGVQKLSRKLVISQTEPIYIDGVFNIFGRKDLYTILWEIFCILIVFFIITLIYIVILLLVYKTKPRENSQFSSKTNDNKTDSKYDNLRDDLDSEGQKMKGQSGRGIFSQKTGLVWQDHMEQRLKFEIERAASFDQDLVLSILRISNYNRTDREMIYSEIAKLILNIFSFQDLAFEFGDDTYAVVIPDNDIDQALVTLKELRDKINNQHIAATIGCSSRNGRLISAQLLISEARIALQKALAKGKNHIYAFRPSADKYRESLL